jgi:hypothetical protein
MEEKKEFDLGKILVPRDKEEAIEWLKESWNYNDQLQKGFHESVKRNKKQKIKIQELEESLLSKDREIKELTLILGEWEQNYGKLPVVKNDLVVLEREKLIGQLDKWIEDCQEQADSFVKRGMSISRDCSLAMKFAYNNTRTLLLENNK